MYVSLRICVNLREVKFEVKDEKSPMAISEFPT